MKLKILIERIYHPYWRWEEEKSNMWGTSKNREEDLQKAIEFTSNHKLYGSYMIEVTKKWKYSCEHNLTNLTQNRRAWIGHAAVALALDIPEDIVRAAWSHLTEQQRIDANNEADKAIKLWEEKHKDFTCQKNI